MSEEIIQNLNCPICGAGMRFANQRKTIVRCIDNPAHRKRVKKYYSGEGITAVVFCKTGPEKLYEAQITLRVTKAQAHKFHRLGAEFVRQSLDKA